MNQIGQIVVSVIMSVYNAEEYLKEAIDSILSQTFQQFEFIIVDDASTDASYSIIKGYTDKRIRIIQNEKNIGLTKSLNKALKYATGKYIARMDADDICFPTRLEKQVKYMEKHKNVALISCSYKEFGNSNHKNILQYNEIQIKGILMYGGVLPHPGFFFRYELFYKYKMRYNEKMKYAQDYAFQVSVSKQFKIACMSEVLIKYRVTNKRISTQKYYEQQMCANRVRQKQFQYYGINYNSKQIELIRKIYMNEQLKYNIFQMVSAYILWGNIVIQIRKTSFPEKEVIAQIALSNIKKMNKLFKAKHNKY